MASAQTRVFNTVAILLGFSASTLYAETALPELAAVEEIRVWGEAQDTSDAGYVSPTSILNQEDMQAINTVTTEDLVKYEPSLVIRRRFIGDSNGTLGIRGSNMFQTSRSMVFADGVPLHYFLQSRWSGAPRWTMVSASEIAQVEVVYGPFSAEYGGNAMGGVVLIETAIPQEREVHIDGSYFTQDFDAYGFDGNVDGFKGFMSYGDKIGDTSFYVSYNHLDNSGQPQSFRDSAITTQPESDAVVSQGALIGNDSRGSSRLWYGDTGVVETVTDNVKLKVGHDFGNWQALLNMAYEDRSSNNVGESYITDIDGNTLWTGDAITEDGQVFSMNSGRLNESTLNRQSLSTGLRLKGEISDNANLEFNFNNFNILKDESISSKLNPNDPNFTLAGQVRDYNSSGWNTAEAKFSIADAFVNGLEIIAGLRHEAYELNLDVYSSSDYTAAVKDNYTSRFGGKTQITALFTQANYEINAKWDAALGLRYESFKSQDGYYDSDDSSTAEFELTHIPSESKSAVSPKFSIGYRPQDDWLVRYSLGKAYRFPIVEELFSQYEAYNTVALSNPELAPEEGLHHNLMLNKTFDGGYVRVNIFQESVENAIESQTDTRTNVRSFVPIDQVDIKGVEFIANKTNAFIEGFDVRFNLAWTDAEIADNSSAESGEDFDSNNSITGNVYPRMPEWRGNVLATYHFNDALNLSANLQYASDSFGRIDNSDTEDNVFGAQDAYTRIGLKAAYQVTRQWSVSIGADNLTNEEAYVAHPWPGRTFYMNFSYDM